MYDTLYDLKDIPAEIRDLFEEVEVTCGAGWRRVVEASGGAIGQSWHDHSDDALRGNRLTVSSQGYTRKHLGWKPSCSCGIAETVPAVVLEPFAGSGTTLAVALSLGRHAIGIELNEEYIKLAHERIAPHAAQELLPL